MGAGAAFVVDVAVSYVVSMATQPKPEPQLVGLVYSLTPRETFHDPRDANEAWYQKPGLLAGISLTLIIILNIIFG